VRIITEACSNLMVRGLISNGMIWLSTWVSILSLVKACLNMEKDLVDHLSLPMLEVKMCQRIDNKTLILLKREAWELHQMIITQKPEVLEHPQTIVLPKLEVWDLLMIKEEAITYQQMLEVKIDLLVDHKQIMASVQLLQMEELNLLHNQGEVTEEL
jgi:hypothetical protein